MFQKRPVNPVRIQQPIQPGSQAPFAEPGLQQGFDPILAPIIQLADERELLHIAFDGTHGAHFQPVLQTTVEALEKRGHRVVVAATSSFLKTSEELRHHFNSNITDNRAFGYFTNGTIEDYFRPEAKQEASALLTKMQEALPASDTGTATILITFGPGAYWLGDEKFDITYFLDVSREYQQMEHKQHLLNFGFNWNRDDVEKYKISLFVEWPIFETYRKNVLDSIHYYIDMNQPKAPVLTTTHSLRQMIAAIAQAPMRVKPFFAPGVWGGQFLKEFADLPADWANCAWGFEPIAPENSIIVDYEGTQLELPFLTVMHYEHHHILGERLVELFGDYFPIRFDYLDTIEGSNLSLQVHPQQEYIRNEFNEFMAQQESYYIMEKEGDATVYLGLTDSCTKDGLLDAVQTAQETGVPIPFTDYVNSYTAEKGDLFLIPTGTVHASGRGNLVLEISSTTWWFTFKIYDYLRKGMDGKPRPINIDHAFENIDFYKKTEWVENNLIPTPTLLKSQGDNEEYLLGQRDDLLFYVRRLHLQDTWQDNTGNEMVMYNLVEGELVRIVSCADESVYVEFRYAESYILPASFGEYKIINLGKKPCKLIKAGVSPTWDVSLLDG
ncbi:class I mannose-6-phosphate isomerase [Paenibacillus herberti]|uniref:Mannose-6-phosphate isomerase n=1 Tax=Paenibacillus herberti TaxID=1619309 RepID=A0A229NYF0_9BACL|nr:class I mannose-6-phosphate isomerase [Paenibacillus herberti]OXM14775.1 mannose-6-phosphate isomerase [Paenibacillus herberti]